MTHEKKKKLQYLECSIARPWTKVHNKFYDLLHWKHFIYKCLALRRGGIEANDQGLPQFGKLLPSDQPVNMIKKRKYFCKMKVTYETVKPITAEQQRTNDENFLPPKLPANPLLIAVFFLLFWNKKFRLQMHKFFTKFNSDILTKTYHSPAKKNLHLTNRAWRRWGNRSYVWVNRSSF